jgi:hypothetical protein
VLFPSQKVNYFEFITRHFGKRPLFYAYQDAVTPMLLFDASVRSQRTGDCNEGGQPNVPTSFFPTTFNYDPGILGYEPQTRSGAPRELVKGYFRWTRDGLKGVDFGGKTGR